MPGRGSFPIYHIINRLYAVFIDYLYFDIPKNVMFTAIRVDLTSRMTTMINECAGKRCVYIKYKSISDYTRVNSYQICN